MAVGFTEHLALYHNSMRWLSIFLCCIPALWSCTPGEKAGISRDKRAEVPLHFVPANDSLFSSKQDTVLLNGVAFSGVQFLLYPNGDTAMLTPFLNGLQEGICKKWYPGKQPAEERLFIAGKKEGIHKGWWPNGQPKFWFEISNDVYTGDFKEWNNNGILIKQAHYKNGQEDGRQQLFFDDGTIKSNYVIRNGRRYGLLGTKNCTNVSDSISGTE